MDQEQKKAVSIYKKIESDLKEQNENLISLEKKLGLAQSELSKIEANLETAEALSDSTNLTTVSDVEKARKDVEKARVNLANYKQVFENIEIAIENSNASNKELTAKLHTQKRKIFEKLAEEKAQEIQKVAGHLFQDFCAIAPYTGNGISAFFGGHIPRHLSFITAQGVDLKKIASRIFEEVLK